MRTQRGDFGGGFAQDRHAALALVHRAVFGVQQALEPFDQDAVAADDRPELVDCRWRDRRCP